MSRAAGGSGFLPEQSLNAAEARGWGSEACSITAMEAGGEAARA
jgi:hypothetical protein